MLDTRASAKLVVFICLALTTAIRPSARAQVSLVDYCGSEWRYKEVAHGAGDGFQSGSEPAGFTTGTAPFGNDDCDEGGGYPGVPCPHVTFWSTNTDLLLRKTVSLGNSAVSLEVGIAIDNNVQVWFNGVDFSSGMRTSAGCATPDRWVFDVPAQLLQVGENLLAIRADDRGLHSYLDARVSRSIPETVVVGNPGNAGELSGGGAGGYGPDRICGAVDYVYHIGKFEVTAKQYTEFLNSVGETDTYTLYNEYMDTDLYPAKNGCNIKRSGSSGSYAYSVAPNWGNRPVNYVSWGNAARFCNWLHNGQPSGAQDLTTTEDGSYYLNGAIYGYELIAVVRKAGATWVIPSEDEWYKAAYHKNDGVTGNYYDYPACNDTVPNNDLIDPDPGNNANFYIDTGDYAIGSPYWRTPVGEFENSQSCYGTFDQGGNVWEHNEGVFFSLYFGIRAGGFVGWGQPTATALRAAYRAFYSDSPDSEGHDIGFRVALIGDADSDSVQDHFDNCPNTANANQGNLDGDAFGDVCDPCPFDPTNTQVEGQCIPTLSEWGMMAMAGLMLLAGGMVIKRRRGGTVR